MFIHPSDIPKEELERIFREAKNKDINSDLELGTYVHKQIEEYLLAENAKNITPEVI